MSNQIKSVLLPGSFFNIESKRKIQYLNQKEINTLYLFDHTLNPLNKKDDISYINEEIEVAHQGAEYLSRIDNRNRMLVKWTKFGVFKSDEEAIDYKKGDDICKKSS